MASILITGSSDGLGRLAAQALLAGGHDVIVHARNLARLSACQDLLDAGARGVHGDLSDQDEVRGIAEQVNRLGQPGSVIHNAGVLDGPVLSVNVVAPYLLTALLPDAGRHVYLSSSMHRGGSPKIDRYDFAHPDAASYSDSKFLVTALMLALAACASTSSPTPSTPAGSPPRWAAPGPPTTSTTAGAPRRGSPPARTPPLTAPGGTGTTAAARTRTRRRPTPASRTNSS